MNALDLIAKLQALPEEAKSLPVCVYYESQSMGGYERVRTVELADLTLEDGYTGSTVKIDI